MLDPALAAALAPHHAVYRLSLDSTRDGSQIAAVVGGMEFTWNDVCQGWTTEQKFRVRFLYTQGEDQVMSTSYATWESKDGRVYRFNVRKTATGQPDQELRGEADLPPGAGASGAGAGGVGAGGVGAGGVAHFQRPQRTDIPLDPGTLFPTAHTLMLLDNARQGGGTLQVRPVFDGSELEGAAAVSAVVGKARPLDAKAIPDPGLRQPVGWPVHLAFFPRDAQQAPPDYDTKMVLLGNGVIQSMLIDYGDFTVRADLVTLQALPRPHC